MNRKINDKVGPSHIHSHERALIAFDRSMVNALAMADVPGAGAAAATGTPTGTLDFIKPYRLGSAASSVQFRAISRASRPANPKLYLPQISERTWTYEIAPTQHCIRALKEIVGGNADGPRARRARPHGASGGVATPAAVTIIITINLGVVGSIIGT